MSIELKILLFVVPAIVVITRCAYLYCMAWKWNMMIMSYLEYREPFQSKAIQIIMSEAAFNIPWKRGVWFNLAFWDEAQYCFEVKGNVKLWFEITDHWESKSK